MHPSTLNLLALSALPAALAAGSVHVVKVGDGGLKFEPSQTKAAVGDIVEFHFYPGMHSVAQSSFKKPCEPLNSTSFFSGDFSPEKKVDSKVFSINVTSEDPIWYYCAVQGHCAGGMVGVINAPTSGDKTFKAFAKAASDSNDSVPPQSTGGGKIGPAATSTGASSTASSEATSSESGSAASATSSETSSPNAGLEARGEIRWGLMSMGVAMAGLFGGLMM
ncbi:hypothetical protein ACHAPJ_001222 [Fusarium lateritium]